MSNQIIKDKLVAGIGRVSLRTQVSESFPMVGEKVTLTAITKWAQRVNFKKMGDPAASQVEEIVENTTQSADTEIVVAAEGELRQDVRAWNYGSYMEERFSDSRKRMLYAMIPQELPYHEVEVSTEIARTDEDFFVILSSDNGYELSREDTIVVYILKENGDATKSSDVLAVRTQADFALTDGKLISTAINIAERGIYDVETSYSNAAAGKTIRKRVNKLVTITPRLATRPTEGQEPIGIITGDQNTQIKMYKTGENDLYCTFEIPNLTYYSGISIADMPAGYDAYTLVLSKPYSVDDNCYSKIWLKGNGNGGVANASGTPNFSFERPLVITIDSEIPVEFHGYSYNCVSYIGDVHNTVWDGRGYHNLHNGIRFTKNPATGHKPVTNMQLLNGTSDVEVFECEFTDVTFSPIMSKTDPSSDKPQYWKGNFEEKRFWWHHNWTHDTDCEGCYLGYFDSGYQSMTYTGNDITLINLAGEEVKYYSGQSYKVTAHQLTNFRFYRNTYEHTGYDGVQISNSFGEVCYNRLYDCAWKQEASQTSGLSIQGFSGKCYNNEVIECYGPNIQMGPIGDIDFFNNVVYSSRGSGIQMLFSYNNLYQNPEDAPEGSGVVNNTMRMVLHNNVIATPSITVNGRNTVQVRGLHMYDNLIANNGNLVGNMTSITETQWKDQAVSNAIIKFTELYNKSEEYKIADYESGDFRIAYNSPLASIGLGTSFEFDHNGYLNWMTGGISPIGPYQGKYIDASIVHVPLTLLSVFINDDAEELDNTTVSISYSYSGNATHYRLGEQADLNDAEWVNLSASPITYQLKNTDYGVKTVYMQLKNNSEISDILRDSINYTYKSLILDSITINNGAASTWETVVSVILSYTESSTTAESYRAAESEAALETAEWIALVNPFDFTLSEGTGVKALYAQMRDNEGNITDIVSSSIELVEMPQEITAISLQWPLNNFGYDDGGKINLGVKNTSVGTQNLLSNLGNIFAKMIRITLSAASFSDSYAGAVTGDDSFPYKDKYMYRNQPITAYYGGSGSLVYSFTDIATGKYRVRIFASSVNEAVVNDNAYYKAYTGYGTDNQVEYSFEKPMRILNNVSEWMIKEIDILDDGLLTVEFGMTSNSATALRLGVMNIIDFVKVVPITDFEIGIKDQTGTYIQFFGICQPDKCTEDDFTWSIRENTQSATINPRTGLLSINPTATTEEIITVQAVSPYNAELVKTKQVTIQYDAPLESLAIVGNTTPIGKNAVYSVAYTPVTTTQRNVVWSIRSQDNGVNASIEGGKLTFSGSGNVSIKVASTNNPAIFATLDVAVTYYDADVVEYFENSVNGGLFFDSGILPTLETSVELTVIPDTIAGTYDIFGSRTSSSDTAKMYMFKGNNQVSAGMGTINTGNVATAFDLSQKVVLKLDKDTYVVTNGDNTFSKAVGTTDEFTSERNLHIGKINTTESNRFSLKGKFYSCRIWKSDVLVGHFLPCFHDGVLSLVNIVDGSYHDNLGSGTEVTYPG